MAQPRQATVKVSLKRGVLDSIAKQQKRTFFKLLFEFFKYIVRFGVTAISPFGDKFNCTQRKVKKL
jgi:hypothetical protein